MNSSITLKELGKKGIDLSDFGKQVCLWFFPGYHEDKEKKGKKHRTKTLFSNW